MKICILSSFEDLLLKDNGSSVRIYNLAKNLVGIGHEVHVVIPSSEDGSKCVDGIFIHGFSGIYSNSCLRVFSKLLSVLRQTSLLFYDPLFILKASRTILKCDLIQIEQSSAGGFIIPLLTKVFKKPLVIDCHDAFQALRIGHTNTLRRILETCLEKMAYKFANVVLAVSQREKSVLTSNGIKQDKVKVIPNGVDTQLFKFLSKTIHPPNRRDSKNHFTVVFVGNMDYPPNQEAVYIIATKIAPKVSEENINVNFLIVGRSFDNLNLPMLQNLTFAGVVDDIVKVLATSNVAIAPLLHGSGTRLKILEYFACGLPVVSTTVGVEGLEVKDRLNVLIEDDMNKFAESIVNLLRDKTFSTQLGKAAREFATNKYDWRKIIIQLDEVYRDLMHECII